MKLDLKGKTALVTGGGSGIGQSVCFELAIRGARVAVMDLDLKLALATANQIVAQGGKAQAYECDVSDHSRVKQCVSGVVEEHGVDILVNSAGIAHIGKIEDTSESELDSLYAVNVKGIYNTSYAVIDAMKSQGQGVIVNLGSVASTVGIADRFAYSMTKGAVLAMTYSVAKDYVADGIRCNCVSPARVHTPFVDKFLQNNYPDNRQEMFDELSATQPIGRMGKPEEIAGLICYLCTDEASFITGSNFPIDGGFVTLNN